MNASPTAQAPDRRSGRRAAVVLLQLLIGVALVAGAGFGSRGGASRFDGTTWITWQKRDGLAGEKVRSLLVDDDGAIWFGAEYDGAARWNGNRWWYVGSSSGLAGNEVKAMLQDQHGNVWFGTEDGVSRCAREVVR